MNDFAVAIVKTTEEMIIECGYKQLSGEALKERIVGKTIKGDYYLGRHYEYISYIDENGTTEGVNDVGTHCVGEWSVNMDDGSLIVNWGYCWENWTGRAYDVDGEIQFYDGMTHLWRTTFKTFEEGKLPLKL